MGLPRDPSRPTILHYRGSSAPTPAAGVRSTVCDPLRRVMRPRGAVTVGSVDAGCGRGSSHHGACQAAPDPRWSGSRDRSLAGGIARARSRDAPASATAASIRRRDRVAAESDSIWSWRGQLEQSRTMSAPRPAAPGARPGWSARRPRPGYYRRWLVFGRRVNFDVPGHVRPGYVAEQLIDS